MRLPLAATIKHFDALASTWDQGRPDSRGMWWRGVRQTLLDRVETDSTDVVMELGCGTGELLHVLAPHVARCVGVDCSTAMLALADTRAPPRPNLQWRLGDLRDPPAVPGLTTVVLCHVVRLLSADERRALFARLHEMLDDQGLVVIGGLLWSVPPDQVEGVDDWLDPDVDHVVMTDDLAKELQGAGFRTRVEILHPGAAIVRGLKASAAPGGQGVG